MSRRIFLWAKITTGNVPQAPHFPTCGTIPSLCVGEDCSIWGNFGAWSVSYMVVHFLSLCVCV